MELSCSNVLYEEKRLACGRRWRKVGVSGVAAECTLALGT